MIPIDNCSIIANDKRNQQYDWVKILNMKHCSGSSNNGITVTVVVVVVVVVG
jgi:hypothetical protein